jgi:hypothetical protein
MMLYKSKNPYQNTDLKIKGYEKAVPYKSKNPYQNPDLKKQARDLLVVIFDT